MSLFREIPPTAGFPLLGADLLALVRGSGDGNPLEQDFKTYLHAEYAGVVCSGTAAFYVILNALKALSSKRTVVMPAYICPLVPLAIHRAGLRVEVCDIQPNNFDFALDELDALCAGNPDVAAIVATHLAGFPVDLEAIRRIATRYDLIVIEDCAQALGALYRGQPVGTWGDFAFLSLCRGKGLTIYEGGVAVTRHRAHAPLLDSLTQALVKHDWVSEGIKCLELLGYGVCYRPAVFWFASRLPELWWNLSGRALRAAGEEFPLDFPVHRVSRIRQAVGHAMFHRLDDAIRRQRQLALNYQEALRGVTGLTVMTESAESRATYPHVTLLFDEPTKRQRVLARCQRLGIGASQLYTSAITDYAYLNALVPRRSCPHAQSLAARTMTLSTSSFVTPREFEQAVAAVKAL